MLEFELFSIPFIISAVFDAVVHISGEELFQQSKLKFKKRLLHNHDLQKAIVGAYRVALRRLRRRFNETNPSHKEKKLAAKGFNTLRSQFFGWLEKDAKIDFEGYPDLIEIPVEKGSLLQYRDAVVHSFSPGSLQLKKIFQTYFIEEFAEAFRELSLKHHPEAYAIIMYEILKSLKTHVKESEDILKEIREQITQNGRDVLDGVDEMKNMLREMQTEFVARQINQYLDGRDLDGKKFLLIISDQENRNIGCFKVGSENISIGRGLDNSIQLLDKRVSRTHALILTKNDKFYVKDLQSKHGTFLNNKKIASAVEQQFGPDDRIRIESFNLSLLKTGVLPREQVETDIATL